MFIQALGAAGGVEAVICAAVPRGEDPAHINYETPDPDRDLNYGTEG